MRLDYLTVGDQAAALGSNFRLRSWRPRLGAGASPTVSWDSLMRLGWRMRRAQLEAQATHAQ